jgi:uncharacterized membrane protein
MKKLPIVLAFMGMLDSLYLVYEHYAMIIPPCPTNPGLLIDCGVVLSSKFSSILGVPLALLGLIHYVFLLSWLVLYRRKFANVLALVQGTIGAVFSLYLIFLPFSSQITFLILLSIFIPFIKTVSLFNLTM